MGFFHQIYHFHADNSAGAVTVTLPAVPTEGDIVHITGSLKTALNTITLDGGSYNVIGNSTTKALTPNGSDPAPGCVLVFNGTKWWCSSLSAAIFA